MFRERERERERERISRHLPRHRTIPTHLARENRFHEPDRVTVFDSMLRSIFVVQFESESRPPFEPKANRRRNRFERATSRSSTTCSSSPTHGLNPRAQPTGANPRQLFQAPVAPRASLVPSGLAFCAHLHSQWAKRALVSRRLECRA